MWRYKKISNQLANKGILVTQMHCILKKSISERGTQVGALVIGNLGNYKQHDFRTNALYIIKGSTWTRNIQFFKLPPLPNWDTSNVFNVCRKMEAMKIPTIIKMMLITSSSSFLASLLTGLKEGFCRTTCIWLMDCIFCWKGRFQFFLRCLSQIPNPPLRSVTFAIEPDSIFRKVPSKLCWN